LLVPRTTTCGSGPNPCTTTPDSRKWRGASPTGLSSALSLAEQKIPWQRLICGEVCGLQFEPKDVMPLLKLETNVALVDDKRQALLGMLSKIVAETIGKPEQYV